mmetsp:Transcript_31625/g.97752  ORF Transcript_31625/g.97752 Transcript_31625/m.97752 type:complete len:1661 (+) Transcript_31625:88-5070(+)
MSSKRDAARMNATIRTTGSPRHRVNCNHVRVGLRIHPCNHTAPSSAFQVNGNKVVELAEAGMKISEHRYDAVFGPAATTAQVHETIASPLVQNTLGGYNSTILTYGQAASGKTHTMVGNDDEPGILKLSMAEIFGALGRKIGLNESLVRVSYLELHNEVIRDLLKATTGTELHVIDDPTRGSIVSKLHEEVVTSMPELNTAFSRGERHRLRTGSRSHAIFNIIIESNSSAAGVALSVLSLVDLASSDCQRVGVADSPDDESTSLIALNSVVSMLALAKKPTTHVPYRESKLTRILQGSLGGNTQTCVIATIFATSQNREHTKKTLTYASHMRHIINTSRQIIIDSKDSMLSSLKSEIDMLKEALAAEKSQSSVIVELTQANKTATSEMNQARAQADQMHRLLKMTVTASKAAQKVGEYATSHRLQRNMKAVATGRRQLQSVIIENRRLITPAIAGKLARQDKLMLQPRDTHCQSFEARLASSTEHTRTGKTDSDDDDDDDDDVEEFLETSIEALTARTTTCLRTASHRHLVLKAECDSLRDRRATTDMKVCAVRVKARHITAELDELKRRRDNSLQQTNKNMSRRITLAQYAQKQADEADRLLVLHRNIETKQVVSISGKNKAETSLRQLHIQVTLIEENITERKLQLVYVQDETGLLRFQAKAVEANSNRLLGADLPAAKWAHALLCKEKAALDIKVVHKRSADIDLSSDVDSLEKSMFLAYHDIKACRVESACVVDELTTTDTAVAVTRGQCKFQEAATALSLTRQVLNFCDMNALKNRLITRQAATRDKEHALTQRRESKQCTLMAGIAPTSGTMVVGLISTASFGTQALVEAGLAALNAKVAIIQIQCQRSLHKCKIIRIRICHMHGLKSSLRKTAIQVQTNIDKLVGRELTCHNSKYSGALAQLDAARNKTSHAGHEANEVLISLKNTRHLRGAVTLAVDWQRDVADAASTADTALTVLHIIACDELLAASSARMALQRAVGCFDLCEPAHRAITDALQEFVIENEVHAANMTSLKARAVLQLARARSTRQARHIGLHDSDVMNESTRVENYLKGRLRTFRDAQRALRLSDTKNVKYSFYWRGKSSLRAAIGAESARLQHALTEVKTRKILLYSSKCAAIAVEQTVNRMKRDSSKGALQRMDFMVLMANDELAAAQAATLSYPNIAESLDQHAMPEAATTLSANSQLRCSSHACTMVSDRLWETLSEEVTQSAKRAPNRALRASKKASSASLRTQLWKMNANNNLLKTDLEEMHNMVTISKIKLDARNRRELDKNCILGIWHHGNGKNGMYMQKRSYQVVESENVSRSYSSNETKRLCTAIERESLLSTEISKTLEALKDAKVKYDSLCAALLSVQTELELVLSSLNVAHINRRSLQKEDWKLFMLHASSVKRAKLTLSKQATIQNNTKTAQASLLVIRNHMERTITVSEESHSVIMTAESRAGLATALLNQQRSFKSRHVTTNIQSAAKFGLDETLAIFHRASAETCSDYNALLNSALQQQRLRDSAVAETLFQTRASTNTRHRGRSLIPTHNMRHADTTESHEHADKDAHALSRAISSAKSSFCKYTLLTRDNAAMKYCCIRKKAKRLEADTKNALESRQELLEAKRIASRKIKTGACSYDRLTAEITVARVAMRKITTNLEAYRQLQVYHHM